MKSNELRCVHRQDIKHHPSCFRKGLVNYVDSRQFEKLTGQSWWKMPGYRIGYLDIETDGLKADFSTMLSWAIKEKGGETAVGVITKEELFNGVYDRNLVQACVDEMRKYSIIITYFGSRFDIPYIRTKCLHYGIEFPGYGEIYHFDLFYLVKSKLNLSKKSLDNACDYLGIQGKTPIDKESWRRAKYGDSEALEEVVRHNIPDVVILEQLHEKVEPFQKFTRKSI